jgi:hypothetical protein
VSSQIGRTATWANPVCPGPGRCGPRVPPFNARGASWFDEPAGWVDEIAGCEAPGIAPAQADHASIFFKSIVPVRAGAAHTLYLLFTPPTMWRAQEAAAWTFGLRPDEYRPRIET